MLCKLQFSENAQIICLFFFQISIILVLTRMLLIKMNAKPINLNNTNLNYVYLIQIVFYSLSQIANEYITNFLSKVKISENNYWIHFKLWMQCHFKSQDSLPPKYGGYEYLEFQGSFVLNYTFLSNHNNFWSNWEI